MIGTKELDQIVGHFLVIRVADATHVASVIDHCALPFTSGLLRDERGRDGMASHAVFHDQIAAVAGWDEDIQVKLSAPLGGGGRLGLGWLST